MESNLKNTSTKKQFYSWLLSCFFLFVFSTVYSQDPQYFIYDDENGLPSNEVYSIAQDAKGFIWLGCDAGLFKFDGIRYTAYKNQFQKSKSITGLCFSKTNVLFCYNFQSQLFYVKNEELIEIEHKLEKISSITCDDNQQLIVNHINGISFYNLKERTWKTYTNFGVKNPFAPKSFTNSARISSAKKISFLSTAGIGHFEKGRIRIEKNNLFKEESAGYYILEPYEDELWMFSVNNKGVFVSKNGKIKPFQFKALDAVLENQKITQVKSLRDGNLWICTYKGIIRFHPKKKQVRLYYPEFSFSNCLLDKENNYWFSTLQSGIIRVSNLNYLVWNSQNKQIENARIVKMVSDGENLYFTSVDGTITQLTIKSNELKIISSSNNADIQSLNYSKSDGKVYFFQSGELFSISKGKVSPESTKLPIVKSLLKVGEDVFILSSFGTYLLRNSLHEKEINLNQSWSRDIVKSTDEKQIWIATNDGIFKFQKQNQKWRITQKLFLGKQFLSLSQVKNSNAFYALSFEGKIWLINEHDRHQLIASLPADVQGYKLLNFQDRLFIATNKGLFVYRLQSKNWKILNTLSGLASNNVQDVCIVKDHIWLATGKGLQKIPLKENLPKTATKIYLKQKVKTQLAYNETLVIYPEVASYSSNGIIEYAYRVNNNEWVKLPGTKNEIEFQNLPIGRLKIELKSIDHLGRDSVNTLVLQSFVKAPFWFQWWFILICLSSFLYFVYWIFKRQLRKNREQMELVNELNLLKLTALKSQMNPHFIFNVLSSIKGYIYENDRQKATNYLDDFSDLIRIILEKSEVQTTTLADELKTIQLYIDLEAMMLENFSYEIRVSDNLNTQHVTIPSLVLQPYIENAFKHGLRHLRGAKKLTLNIDVENSNTCIIELEDNGIGRKEAAIVNEANTLKHASFATTALEKRIALYNQEFQNLIAVETIDLMDADQQSRGTKIRIVLRMKEG